VSSWREIAFRAEGRLSEIMRIRPVFGAGMSVAVIRGVEDDEYGRMSSLRDCARRRRVRVFLLKEDILDVFSRGEAASEAGLWGWRYSQVPKGCGCTLRGRG
jgi:hypothetical protein